MAQTEQPGYEARLEELRGRVEDWRKTREKCSRMPKELWEVAVELAQIGGAEAVARALSLNYESLERRVSVKENGSSREASRAVFMEFAGSAIPAECVIELEEGDGAKMKIRLRGSSDRDVESLMRAFWGRGQ